MVVLYVRTALTVERFFDPTPTWYLQLLLLLCFTNERKVSLFWEPYRHGVIIGVARKPRFGQ